MLFNCSVRDNIALADPSLPIERIIAVAEMAGAHEFILELPNGYDTMVGEREQACRAAAASASPARSPRFNLFDDNILRTLRSNRPAVLLDEDVDRNTASASVAHHRYRRPSARGDEVETKQIHPRG